jgi:cell division protease FtsH
MVLASSPELGNRPQSIRVEIPVGASQLIQKLKDYNIDFDAHPIPRKSLFVTIASNLILPLIFIAGLIFFFQNSDNFSQNAGNSPMNLGKSPARFDQRPDTGISFDDIAGIDEAKAEFEEIVSFLKEPERYTLVGAKIPKGVLLVGPPGTGKTLLAKAIANEASVPFYSVAGSEFVEMFIGIGAARIRDLFKKASENTPCIVFIDEIDAVGRERGAGIGGGNDEREQTLNQLLTEMDGFKENKGVIVVGATNRVDILDAALLRPGRFDRQITVGLPDRLGRLGILKVHARNKPLNEDVSLVQLANRTPGFSGADLANLLNESAILATRYKKQTISKNEVNEAADRIIGGIAGSSMEDTKNKKLIAYHEVGHAIVGSLLENHDAVEKVTLIPRGGAKGLTWFAPEEDATLVSRSQLLARIITTLGGRVAEKVVFGDQEITTGASNDLQQVTSVARQMVTRYGMSSIGPIALEDNNNEQIFLGGDNEAITDRIDAEVCKIVNHCEKVATKIILDNRVVIDLIVEKLLDSETITGDEFREFVSQYTIPPVKR